MLDDEDGLPAGVKEAIGCLASGDRGAQGKSYQSLLDATAAKVSWGDAAWQQVMPLLQHKDNRVRSIAGQVLCNLAASASSTLVERDLCMLIAVTHDERFVTARHVLLALWKLGVQDAGVRGKLLDEFFVRFASSEEDKNGTLIRYDIQCAMRSLFDATGDEMVKAAALALIPTEQDEKYRKKYAGAWRTVNARIGPR